MPETTKDLKERILKNLDSLQNRVNDLKELEALRTRGLKIRYWKIAQKSEDIAGVMVPNLENIAATIEIGEELPQETANELRRIGSELLDYHSFVERIAETEDLATGNASVIRDIRYVVNDINCLPLTSDIHLLVEKPAQNTILNSLGLNLIVFILGMIVSYLISQLFQ